MLVISFFRIFLEVFNMKFQEIKVILKDFSSSTLKTLKKIFIALFLSIIVAGSTSAIAAFRSCC